MKKIVFVIFLAVSVLYANANIEVGTLSYSLEKGDVPINLAPAAKVYPDYDDNDGYWVTVRFPGYENFYTVDRGFYPGWSSGYNPLADMPTATGPKGYTYVFELGVTDSNDFFDYGRGSEYRLRHILNPDGIIEDKYVYDEEGFVDKIYDGNDLSGVYLDFSYDSQKGEVTSITAVDPSVSSTSFNYSRNYDLVYDTTGRLVSIANTLSSCGCSCGGSDNWLTDVYDTNDNLIEQKDPQENTVYTYSYNINGALAEKENGSGQTIFESVRVSTGGGYKDTVYNYVDSNFYRYSENIYDSSGSMTEKRVYKELRDKRNDPNTFDTTYFSTHYLYSGNNEIEIPDGAPTDASGERTISYYDSQYRLTKIQQYSQVDTTTASRDSQQTTYSTDGFTSRETDQRGAQTEYEYIEDTGLISKKIMPSDQYSVGRYYLYEYDNQNRLIKETLKIDDADGGDWDDTAVQSKHYEYDVFGNVCKEYLNGGDNRSDPNSIVTEYVYNAFGDLVWQISPAGVVSGKVYNSGGELTDEFVLAGGLDAFDAITDPLDCDYSGMLVLSQRQYQYNSVNGKKEFVSVAISDDAFVFDTPDDWNITKYIYDLYGRKTSEIKDFGGENLTTTFTYNLQDEIVSTTDATGKTTQTIRDGRGLTTQVIETGGSLTRTTDYIYDNRGRLVETKVNNTAASSYEYELFDRIEKVYKGNANSPYYTEYQYDGNTDEVETETVWDNDGTNDVEVSKVFKKYDIGGRVIFQREYADPTDESNITGDKLTYYKYDAFGNVTLEANKGIGNYYSIYSDMGYNYDYLIIGDGFATMEDYYAGDIATVYKYNNNGRLLAVVKGYSLDLTDVDILDAVDLVGGPCNDANSIEAFIAASDADVSLTKYGFTSGEITSQSVYTGVIDNGEPVFVEAASYEYDTGGRRSKITKPDNSYIELYHNSISRQIESTVYNAQDEPLRKEQSVYDALGRPVWQVTFRDPNRIDIDLNADRIIGHEYNSGGQLSKQGVSTGYTSFEVVDMTVIYHPIFAYNEFAYDGLGRKTSTTDPHGNQEIVTYDSVWSKPASKQIVRVSTADENDTITTTTGFVYDFAGRLAEVDEQGFSNDIIYSYFGDRKVQETLADGTVNQYAFDGFGNECLTLMDSSGIEQYTYRYFDRLSRLTGISGFTNGNTSGNELLTLYDYDYKGNIVSITYPDSTTIEYEYNYLGKVTERRDRQDNITEYTYNAGGYLFQKNNIFEIFTPDENDPNIIHITRDSKPWQLYTHDALGRLTNVCLLEIEGEQQLQIAAHSREYDGLDNITKTSDGHISGTETDVEYGYYPNGQISSIEYPGGKTVSYQSYGDDLVDEISCGDEIVAEYDYIGEKVLDRRLPRIGEATWFTYDARGRVTGEEIYDIVTDAAISTTTYAYKTNTDLISSKTIDSSTQTYQYDDLERLTQYGTTTYSLNDISEETSPPTPDYNYYVDVENRVTDVNDLSGAQVADYSYDALGRRNKKIVYDGGNSSITYYVYDIMGRVITEYKQTTGEPVWSRDYIYGSQGELVSLHLPRTSAMNTAFDNLVSFAEAWLCDPNCPAALLAWDTTDDDYIDYYDYVDNTVYFEGAFSSNIYYCLTDKNNSVIGIADANDITYIAYDGWGTPNYTGDIQGLSILWNGYYFDEETDNYYLRNRYYSPAERRFLTDDPHGIVPDENWNNPLNILNQYADGVGLTVYAGFNPITSRDDWGLSERSDIIIVIGPIDSIRIRNTPDDAVACISSGQGRKELSGAYGGEADAVRHCTWLCLMTQRIGRRQAWLVGSIHEQHNPPGERIPMPYKDREEWERADSIMDLHNNSVGVRLGSQISRCTDCCTACRNALKEGGLIVNSRGGYKF